MGDYPPQYYSPRARKYYRKRPSVAGGGGGGASVGSWKELGRTTLGSASQYIDVSSLSNKRYYMVLANALPSGSNNVAMTWRVGNSTVDQSNNYSTRYSFNGGTDSTGTSLDRGSVNVSGGYPYQTFDVGYFANYSSKEKLFLGFGTNSATGSGNSPNRTEQTFKWSNSSNAIDVIRYSNHLNAVNIASGSELVVLGYDPADEHTTTDNFWQELSSIQADGSSTNLSSGTISGKKYLLAQIYQQGTSADLSINFNNDTGSNYCDRYNINNAEGTRTNQTKFQNWLHQGYGGQSSLITMFIINNSSNEKLVIAHSITTGGSTSANVPRLGNWIGKWTNTSSQITEIETNSQTGNFGTSSFIKVWGAD